jgi:hypothetical protein
VCQTGAHAAVKCIALSGGDSLILHWSAGHARYLSVRPLPAVGLVTANSNVSEELSNTRLSKSILGNGALSSEQLSNRVLSSEVSSHRRQAKSVIAQISTTTFILPRNARSDPTQAEPSKSDFEHKQHNRVVFSKQYAGLFSSWVLDEVP